MRVSQNYGYLFGDHSYEDCSYYIGSILGYPNFGKLPYELASELLAGVKQGLNYIGST